MKQEEESKTPVLEIRAQGEFRALLDRPRPGGSSADVQFFADRSSGALWIGKCSLNAMAIPEARLAGYGHYYEEYKEWLGLMLYRLFGVETPIICLSSQTPRPFQPERLSKEPPEGCDYKSPCVHVMTRFLEGYQNYGEGFLETYHKAVARHEEVKISAVPVCGFGTTLAVACFIYDLDCLGRSGGNMGYVIAQDAAGRRYAKTVKIDPGYAFSFLEPEADLQHDPRQRNMRFAPGKLPGGQTCLIHFNQLNVADQKEFALTAKRILDTPGSVLKAVIDQVVTPTGFTRAQADQLLTGLLARKALFLAGFAPDVKSILRDEILSAKEAFLKQHLQLQAAASKEPDNRKEEKKEAKEKNGSEEIKQPSSPSVPVFLPLSVDVLPQPVPSPAIAVQAASPREEKLRVIEEPKRDIPSPQLQQIYQSELALAKALEESRLQALKAGEKGEVKSSVQYQFQIPLSTAHFQTQGNTLSHLAEQLHKSQSSVVSQGIQGLGGVGKTQLATRYAEAALKQETFGEYKLNYQAVLWLHAEQDLASQFQILAELWCQQPRLSVQDAVKAVYRFLQDKWALLIFDNAETLTSLRPFLPVEKDERGMWQRLFSAQPRIHVLLTSRNNQWVEIPCLVLNGFSKVEAHAFVRQQLPRATDAAINHLLATVTTLPLALAQAVAYIAAGFCTLEEYRQKFALHQLSLGGRLSVIPEAKDTVLTTFLLSAMQLEQRQPGVMALLHTCAFLAPEGIPQSLLKAAWEASGRPAALFETALQALMSQALLQPDKNNTVHIHRLVQQVIRHFLPVAERQATLTRVIQLLGLHYPREGIGHLADATRSAFMPHLITVIEHHDREQRAEDISLSDILDCLGNAYGARGDAHKQRDLLERALAIQEKHYGSTH